MGSSDSLKGYYQDANGKWNRPNEQLASNEEVGLLPLVNSGTHGNFLSYEDTNYGYRLVDKKTGELLKCGEIGNPASRYTQKYLDDKKKKVLNG